MADPGFPDQHTTNTTTTTTTTITNSGSSKKSPRFWAKLRPDRDYLLTIPGYLKCAQLVLDLIGFICIESSKWAMHDRGNFFNFVAMGGFWFTGILLLFYVFHFIEKWDRIPWLRIELGFCVLWTLFYLIAACLAATFGSAAYHAAAFFGFCGMLAYGADAYFKFRAIQTGQAAQEKRTEVKTPTASTISQISPISPAY